MTPEQHAATIRDLEDEIRVCLTWAPNREGSGGMHAGREALDALVALAQDKIAAPEHDATPTLSGAFSEGNDGEPGAAMKAVFMTNMPDNEWRDYMIREYNALADRWEAAEERASQLEHERDEAIKADAWLAREVDQAHREADQLQAALQLIVKEYDLWSEDANDGEFRLWDLDRLVAAIVNARAALAGVQAKEET